MARYDYERNFRGPDRFTRWYPGAFWGGVPMYGWGAFGDAGMWGWPPYPPIGYGGYGRELGPPRRRPDQSPTYGRGGDEAVRRYAREHGYDAGYAITPRSARPPRDRPRYDRGYRGRW